MKSIGSFKTAFRNTLEGDIRVLSDQIYAFKQMRDSFARGSDDQLVIRWGSVEKAENWFCERRNEYCALQEIHETLYGRPYDPVCSFR